MQNISNFVLENWHLDELEVNWDDSSCKLSHKKFVIHKIDYNDLKYHMTVNTI